MDCSTGCTNHHAVENQLQHSNALSSKCKITGDVTVLEKAITHAQEALSLCRAGCTLRPQSLHALAQSLSMQSRMKGDIKLLDDAVELERICLAECPPGHLEYVTTLQRLGRLLSRRCEMSWDAHRLEEAVDLQRNALKLYATGHPGRARALRELGSSLLRKCEMTDDEEALREAIALQEESLLLCPPGHFDRKVALRDLGICLTQQCQMSGDYALLEQAIDLHLEALALCPPVHVDRFSFLRTAASTCFDHFWRTRDMGSFDRASSLLHDVVNDPITPAYLRLQALQTVLNHVHKALNSTRDSVHLDALLPALFETYNSAVGLLPRAAYFGLDTAMRLEALAKSEGLGLGGVLAGLAIGKDVQGFELLEESRGVFWSQALRLRTPLHAIPVEDAATLEHLFNELEQGTINAGTTADWVNPQVTRLRHISEEAEDLIARIRKQPGLDRFLLTRPFSELVMAANKAPVVVFIAHESVCLGLILKEETQALERVELDHLSFTVLTELGARIKETSVRLRSLTCVEPTYSTENGLSSDNLNVEDNAERRINIERNETRDGLSVLSTIWQAVMKPIVSALHLNPKRGRERTRVHFCPTGPFTFLPLHAAGFSTVAKEECVTNYCVVSYTPTITALLNSRSNAQRIRICEADALLAADPLSSMHKLAPLRGAVEEVKVVNEILSPVMGTTVIDNRPGSPISMVEQVTSTLSDASIFHLACHGEQDGTSPLESGFCLRDGRLTVADLMRLKLPKAFLAFLSACETAKGDAKQPDQAVHLAATMLFVGFRSVIATMWSMNDEDGPFVAKHVYQELVKGEYIDTDQVPYALDLAVQRLRQRGVSPHRWAPYIHMGA